MACFERISTPSLGTSLEAMRQYYMTSVRAFIAYGCPAWFRPYGAHHWSNPGDQIRALETMQNYCMRKIAGALPGTEIELLRKELNLETLEMYLKRRILCSQAQALDDDLSKKLNEWRSTPRRAKKGKGHPDAKERHMKELLRHPYHALDIEARKLRERAHDEDCSVDSLKRREDRNDCAKQWESYRAQLNRNLRRDRPSLWERWPTGGKVLKYYRDLDRAESTMLFQIRTGYIPLLKNLHRWKVCAPSPYTLDTEANVLCSTEGQVPHL